MNKQDTFINVLDYGKCWECIIKGGQVYFDSKLITNIKDLIIEMRELKRQHMEDAIEDYQSAHLDRSQLNNLGSYLKRKSNHACGSAKRTGK